MIFHQVFKHGLDFNFTLKFISETILSHNFFVTKHTYLQDVHTSLKLSLRYSLLHIFLGKKKIEEETSGKNNERPMMYIVLTEY